MHACFNYAGKGINKPRLQARDGGDGFQISGAASPSGSFGSVSIKPPSFREATLSACVCEGRAGKGRRLRPPGVRVGWNRA